MAKAELEINVDLMSALVRPLLVDFAMWCVREADRLDCLSTESKVALYLEERK